MWLLNTKTLKLENFMKDVPKYAILSHRWEEKQELTYGNVTKTSRNLKGYGKVRKFCEIARSNGYEYGWVDTCCIDKKSSAELSEAINSMYKWYRESAVCYVYLNDVHSGDDVSNSSWFTRGWTLQELLAPKSLRFFDAAWRPMAWKRDILSQLKEFTGIPRDALEEFNPARHCVANKMSWAAKRETTREEDRAYCLLGLFDVSMPLLYGEGHKAFQRLQEEIMRISSDRTLFIWRGEPCENHGMLASSPSCFAFIAPEFINYNPAEATVASQGWVSNNAGISIAAPIIPYGLAADFAEIYLLLFNESYGSQMRIGIFVRKRSTVDQTYSRAAVDGNCWKIVPNSANVTWPAYAHQHTAQRFLTRQSLSTHSLTGTRGFVVQFRQQHSSEVFARVRPDEGEGGIPLQAWGRVQSQSRGLIDCSFTVHPKTVTGIVGHLVVKGRTDADLVICLGFDNWFRPICILIPFCAKLYSGCMTESALIKGFYKTLRTDTLQTDGHDHGAGVTVLRSPHYTNYTWEFDVKGLHCKIQHLKNDMGHYAVELRLNGDQFLQSLGIPTEDIGAKRQHPDNARQRIEALESGFSQSQSLLFQ